MSRIKLALNNKAHYTDWDKCYELYKQRAKNRIHGMPVYRKVVKLFCKELVYELEEHGFVDLPDGVGSIICSELTRRPQYRGKKFIGYGGYDWKNKCYDGKLKTFGITFTPSRSRCKNIRCLGFVANRALFKKIKKNLEEDKYPWKPMKFTNEMI